VARIVTFNLGDFPQSVLGGSGIEAVHPDEFLARLWDEHSTGVISAATFHRASLRKPPKTAAEYLATLEQCRLPETVRRLRAHEDEIQGRTDGPAALGRVDILGHLMPCSLEGLDRQARSIIQE
jgi:hypothetical protein